MTSYLTHTVARQHVTELIAQAEAGRVRRQFRQARREQRAARRSADARRGPANYTLLSPNRIRIA